MRLTATDTAAILAGLRLLQRADTLPDAIDDILTDGGTLPRIVSTDIDRLCEQVNAPRETCARTALLEEVEARFGAAFDDDVDIDGGDAVEWLGEFLPRARRALSLPQPAVRVVVSMVDGVIQDLTADAPVQYLTLDYDVQGADEEDLTSIPTFDATGNVTERLQAFAYRSAADIDPSAVDRLFDAAAGSTRCASSPQPTSPAVEACDILQSASSVIGELADGWPVDQLHRDPAAVRADLALLSLTLAREAGLAGPSCSHRECASNWVQTDDTTCITA